MPEFVFVDDPDDIPEDATPFDLRGADLSHHDGDCSFETFLRRYDLDDPVLWDLARIVHEADLGDERYDAPEAVGSTRDPRPLDRPRRRRLLELADPLFDGLYELRKRAIMLGREPS